MNARALLVAAVFACTPLTAAAVECDYEIEGDVDTRFESKNDDLVFTRDGVEVVRITKAPELMVGDTPVELDAAGRAELVGYRGAYLDLLDEAKAIGIAGAKLGGKAAFTVLVGLLTGTADKAEAKVEAEAAALEAQAESLCAVVERMRAHHAALAARVPEFAAALPIQ